MSSDGIWRDALLKALTRMLPIVILSGILVAQAYILTDTVINQTKTNSARLE